MILRLLDGLGLHLHVWEGSAWNAYCVAMEERCRCGKRRHVREGTGMHDAPVFDDGPHPVAERLRQSGQTFSEGWTGAWR